MMTQYTHSLQHLIEEFEKLPGIGVKSAERLTFHILKASKEEAFGLAQAIRDVKEKIRSCSICFHISETDPCEICSNPQRDHSTICVVEQPKDLIAFEKTGSYQGVYHVLMGHLAPLDNENPEDLTISQLIRRIKEPIDKKNSNIIVRELIIATNPNVEGDATALYIANVLKNLDIKITRIARGIPTGSSIEFVNQAILIDALCGRQKLVDKDS